MPMPSSFNLTDEILSSFPGASHVLLFNEHGEPQQMASMGRIPDEWNRGLEEFASSMTSAFRAAAARISEANETRYEPVSGWFYTGGEWGVCTASVAHLRGTEATEKTADSGFAAVFFLTKHADPRMIFDAMIAHTLSDPPS
jgi:hypothetical protein